MSFTVPGDVALPLPDTATTASVLAEGLRHAASALSGAEVMVATPDVEGWLGTSANEHVAEVGRLKSAVESCQDLLIEAAKQLEAYQDEYDALPMKIEAHQQEWDANVARYNHAVEELSLDMMEGFAERAALGFRLRDEQLIIGAAYNADVEAVDSAAQEAARKIAAIVDSFAPRSRKEEGGSFLSRDDAGVALFGSGDGILASQSLMADAIVDAEAAAGLLRGAGADGFLTREELDEFNVLYASRMVNDPYFATAFAASFGPDSVAQMALMFEQTPGNTMDEGVVSSFKISYGAVGASMMIGTGSVRTGASRMWDMWREHQSGVTINGESVQEWRRDYLEQVKQTGRSEIVAMIEGDDRLGGLGYGYLGQAWGLAAELHPDLAWGEDFLVGEGSVGLDVLAWERERGAPYELTTSLPYTDTWDPVHNLNLGLDGNPDAVRAFLDSDTGEWSVAQYYAGERYVVLGGASWIDDGDQVGLILDEVTSGSLEDPAKARIVHDFLTGYQHGLSSHSPDELWVENPFGSLHGGLRNWSGEILREYIPDLAHELELPSAVNGSDGSRFDIRGQDYHLAISDGLMNSLTDPVNGFFTDLSHDMSYSPGHTGQEADGRGYEGRPSALSVLSEVTVREWRNEEVPTFALPDTKQGRELSSNVTRSYSRLFAHLCLADEQAAVRAGSYEDAVNSATRNAISDVLGIQSLDLTSLSEPAFDEFLSVDNEEKAHQQLVDRLGELKKNNADLVWGFKDHYDNQPAGSVVPPDIVNLGKEPYVQLLPEDEKFLDSKGNTPNGKSLLPEQRQALEYYHHNFIDGDAYEGYAKVKDERDVLDKAAQGKK